MENRKIELTDEMVECVLSSLPEEDLINLWNNSQGSNDYCLFDVYEIFDILVECFGTTVLAETDYSGFNRYLPYANFSTYGNCLSSYESLEDFDEFDMSILVDNHSGRTAEQLAYHLSYCNNVDITESEILELLESEGFFD